MKKITLSTLLLTGLFISACGQKGPLILNEIPTEKTQAPVRNINNAVPVEQEQTESDSE